MADGQLAAGTLDLTELTRSGPYAVSVEPVTGATGRIDLRILRNLTAPIPVDGAAVAVALKAGQNARYTFAANAGQSLSLGLDQGVVAGALQSLALNLYDPQGQRMNCNGPVSFSQAACQWLTLPVTGTYTLALDTQGTGNFNARLTLSKMLAGTIAANAAAATTAAPARFAQDARYTFNGDLG